MANAPFAQFPGDFESLARQYWNTWNELLGRGGAFDGMGLSGGLPPGLGGMDPGSYDWYQRMQRLAADFSGGGSAADVARAWRDMLGGQGADPFAGMLRSMHSGQAGGEWLEQMRPLLDMLLRPLRQQSADWLQRPAFGPAREHQERLQALALAWQEWEERNEAFTALLAQAGQAAFERFERLLQEHDAPGKRLETARALFDLWIDAAEDAWAEIALSDEYRHAYAEMTNALMRVRLRLQREVEQFGALLGLPGRGELDALHRKVADLERTLHAARRSAKAQATQAAQAAPVAGASAAKPATTQTVAKKQGPAKVEAAKPPMRGAGASTSTKKKKMRKPAKRAAASPVASVEVVAATKTVRGKARTGKPAAASTAAKARSAAGKRAGPATAASAARGKPVQPAKPRRAAPAKPARRTPETLRPVAAAEPARKAAARRAPVRAAAKHAPQASTATARKAKVVKAGAARAPSPAAEQPPAKVVSMKDWVSRNLAAAQPDTGRGGGKRKGRSR